MSTDSASQHSPEGPASAGPSSVPEPIVRVLTDARELGFLGPGPIDVALRHARAHARAAGLAPGSAPAVVCDLGSGGGVPGLVLAVDHPALTLTLVDAMAKRTAFLTAATADLHLVGVEVVTERGETFARVRDGDFDLVVARGLAAPPVTAEIAARLLRPGGRLVVSTGPETAASWSAPELAVLGLGRAEVVEIDGFHFARTERVGACDERYPRRVGIPAKRPLW